MTHIASPQNPRLKSLRRLAGKRERERTGRFVAEGEDLVAAAARAGRPPLEGFRSAGSELGGAGFHDVDPAALGSASRLGSGTRVMAVYEQRWLSAPCGPLCVCLLGVSDPGNVGTVLRGAQAFGASSVALGPGTADPYSPKAVRASMGAVFAVPLARAAIGDLPGTTIALVPNAGRPLEVLWRSGYVSVGSSAEEATILVGSERDGLPEAVVAQADHVTHIPIATDSLNAAMAATIALYELSRRMAPA